MAYSVFGQNAQTNGTSITPNPPGGRNIKAANGFMDQVTMDKKAYEDIMSYLIKMECKRLEKDRVSSTRAAEQALSLKG